MLVLSRKIGERIQIGKDVWVTVLQSDRGRVRLGITAPDSVDIRRDEVPPKDSLAEEGKPVMVNCC